MKLSSSICLLLLSLCFMPKVLPAQFWGVEFSGGYERRDIQYILDPNTYTERPLALRQYDFAPGVWWSRAGTRFGRARLQFSMLGSNADTFGESAFRNYQDAAMRNTMMFGGAIGGGWKGSWRALDWRLGLEGGYARTGARLAILSENPKEEVFADIRETMTAQLVEVQGGCFADLSLRVREDLSIGLEQRISIRWMHVEGEINDGNVSYGGWGFIQVTPPQKVAWPRLWMRMSF